MNDWTSIILGAVGGVALYYGACMLVNGSVGLAEKLRVPKILIALTLVALGTSAPEFVVSMTAAYNGHGGISVGNIIGSTICNIGLILGVSALIYPLRAGRDVVVLDIPVMFLSAVAFGLICWRCDVIGRIWGIPLLLTYVLYTLARLKFFPTSVGGGDCKGGKWGIAPNVLLAVAGIVLLIIGSRYFVDGAATLARMVGVSEAVIGLSIVALGTSLPELATSVVAAIHKESEMAIGNVVGSNIFNILIIMGASPLVRPIVAEGICASDLVFLVLMPALVLAAAVVRGRFSRLSGFAMVAAYAIYVLMLARR